MFNVQVSSWLVIWYKNYGIYFLKLSIYMYFSEQHIDLTDNVTVCLFLSDKNHGTWTGTQSTNLSGCLPDLFEDVYKFCN